MAQGTITAKGQTTVPKAIREKLNLKPGDRINWTVIEGGAIVQRKTEHTLLDLAGIFYDPNRKPMTIEEETEAVMDAVAEDVMRSLKR